jgi:hypothetical protein
MVGVPPLSDAGAKEKGVGSALFRQRGHEGLSDAQPGF